MFEPHYYADGKKLYSIGRELYRMTKDEDIALPVIKSASDYGCDEAARFLALYYLHKTDYPDPYISKYAENKIDYRKAAEFALACRDQELLAECITNCEPGELDDIKARMSAHCKNYNPVKNVCVVSGDACGPFERDWCEYGSYTEVKV